MSNRRAFLKLLVQFHSRSTHASFCRFSPSTKFSITPDSNPSVVGTHNFNYSTTEKLNQPGQDSQRTFQDDDDEEECKSRKYIDFPVIKNNANQDWKEMIIKSVRVYPNFINEEEEKHILDEVDPYLNRLTYESSHWDDAIHNYRETERKNWNKKNTLIINRIRSKAFPPTVSQLQHVHVLDLHKDGLIKPHIDSIRFCGNTIAGLSILSDSVMRLRHDVNKENYADIYLPRFSLYVLTGIARYKFSHEILGNQESFFIGQRIIRDRRISVICRNEPNVNDNGEGNGTGILPVIQTGVLKN